MLNNPQTNSSDQKAADTFLSGFLKKGIESLPGEKNCVSGFPNRSNRGDFMELTTHEAAIEAILFISPEAVEIEAIARAVNLPLGLTEQIITVLMERYTKEKRGIEIIRIEDAWQMRTSPHIADYVKGIYGARQSVSLSQSLLETLAIIAFEQPCTKAEIEAIRGVDASHGVNRLLQLGFISEAGRSSSPGKPILFSTSPEFWRHFGLSGAEELRAFFADCGITS